MADDALESPIYLDYNASCPLHPQVIDAMRPFLFQHYGNPSSSHAFGVHAKSALEEARNQVAKLLGAKSSEIVFTSGGSESINYALKGSAFSQMRDGRVAVNNRIVTSAVEHPAVTETLAYLQKFGFEIVTIPVDSHGIVDLASLESSITPATFLVTIMHANNEVGTIQPIAEVARVVKAKNPYTIVHTDASQSVGKIPVNVNDLGVDLLTVAGHKLYAPKGVGALFIRQGISIDKLHHGANHEAGRRAGTENILLDVALGQACSLAMTEGSLVAEHTMKMRDRLHERLQSLLPGQVFLNGHPTARLPNTLSLAFPGIQATSLLQCLKDKVAASAGSACHAGSIHVSAVLTAMGVDEKHAVATVRFSTGRWTTPEDIDRAAQIVAGEISAMVIKS